MVNRKLLRERIDAKGIKIRFIADKLGISHQSMYDKVNGRTEFKESEIAILIDILDLSPEDVMLIFFTREVA